MDGNGARESAVVMCYCCEPLASLLEERKMLTASLGDLAFSPPGFKQHLEEKTTWKRSNQKGDRRIFTEMPVALHISYYRVTTAWIYTSPLPSSPGKESVPSSYRVVRFLLVDSPCRQALGSTEFAPNVGCFTGDCC